MPARWKYLLRIIELSSIWLFFIQALRVIFSILFGIIYDQVVEGPFTAWLLISLVLVVIAFVLPLLAPSKPKRKTIAVIAGILVVARIGISVNDPLVRYWSSLLVLSMGGLLLSLMINTGKRVVLTGLVLALALDQIFRVLGDTYDISLQQSWIPLQVIWSILLLGISYVLRRNYRDEESGLSAPGLLWGLALGGILFIETSLLSLPNAVARWADYRYDLIAPVLLLLTILPLISPIRRQIIPRICSHTISRFIILSLLVAGVIIGYFCSGLFAGTALLLSQLFLIVLLVCLFDHVSGWQYSAGIGMSAGLIFLLLLNFCNAFSFTYPYTLPFMRGLGWVVYLVACAAVGVALILRFSPKEVIRAPVIKPYWAALFGLMLVLIAIYSVLPEPIESFPQDGEFTAGTYNIHYGYDDPWHLAIDSQAKTIAASGADIIALQEVDTGRMTSYCIDNAYYLARKLGMNVVYLPTVEHLTGIALLYRGDAVKTSGQLVTSEQEQTGVVYALLESGDTPIHAFGTWIGLSNEDTDRQISEVLEFIGDRTPAVFGGDFNSIYGSSVTLAIEANDFLNPFSELDIVPAPNTSPAISPQERIDYVWFRGVEPLHAWVPASLASDHRMVAARFKVEP